MTIGLGMVAAALLSGCQPDTYSSNGGYLGADICPKKDWTASGTLSNPSYAIDGNLDTAALSDYQYTGAELTIDLHRPCVFQTVIIEHGKNERGFARKIAVATSVDGSVFTDRYVAGDSRKVAILSLPGAVLARYVRIRAVTPNTQPWSIAEVNLQ